MADGYTKLFDISASSLIELDIVYRYIFMWMMGIADFNGFFDGSPQSLARRANVPLEDMEKALELFQSPDPDSRSKKEDGRRIIYQGGNRWWMVNKVEYRLKKSGNYRIFRDRLRQARKRALDAGKEWDEDSWVAADALKNGPMSRESHHEDEDEDVDIDIDISSSSSDINISNPVVATGKRKAVAKSPPTVREVYDHIQSKGYKANGESLKLAEDIIEHHKNGGNWRTSAGKPIYVWKSHVNQWISNREGRLTVNTLTKFAREDAARAMAKEKK